MMCVSPVPFFERGHPLRLALALRLPSGAGVSLPPDLDPDHGGKVHQAVEPQAQAVGQRQTGARPVERGAGPFQLRQHRDRPGGRAGGFRKTPVAGDGC